MSEPASPVESRKSRLRDYLALETNVVVVSSAIAMRTLGRSLWDQFLPKYLEALGAGIVAISAFATLRQVISTVYQYPGGWITDRIGRRSAFILFSCLGLVGYLIYMVAPTWYIVLLGLPFVLTGSMSMPAVFAMVGDSLPKEKRAMGFTIQSILRRLPAIVAPPLGGWIIVELGLLDGIRLEMGITVALAGLTVLMQWKYYKETYHREEGSSRSASPRSIWREMDRNLKRLLAADCAARFSSRMIRVFLIFYAVDQIGIGIAQFGILSGLHMAVACVSYLPAARLADNWRRLPFVGLTFLFFGLFPLVLIVSTNFWWLCVAYAIHGLQEMGEPARKALIVDLSSSERRGRDVGLYRTVQSFVMMPAPALGGFLWTIGSFPLFAAAAVCGFLALGILVATVRER